MQVTCFNGVVENGERPRLPQENFRIPEAVRDALVGMWGRIGAKNKWQAYTAAILAFYRLKDEEQDDAMDEVVAARRRGDFSQLLERDVGYTGEEPAATKPAQPPAQAGPKSSGSRRPGKSGGHARQRERGR